MDFIPYADKDNLGAVYDGVIYEPLRTVLAARYIIKYNRKIVKQCDAPKI